MRKIKDITAAMVIVFMSGELVVTAVSFAFGKNGRLFWAIAQVGLVVVSVLVVGMAFASKNRDKE